MEQEKTFKAINGYGMLTLILLLFVGSIAGVIVVKFIPLFIITLLSLILSIGFVIVNPNESAVLVLFGAYKGTIKNYGFFWVNPFFVKKKISLRARNFDSDPIKVNDKVGNPIKIGLVLVWKVEETFRAAFQVDDFQHFVLVQSEAALRKIAGVYPYDNFEDEDADLTLRSGGEQINHELEKEIAERLELAGIHVIEARINYIAYAEEIASAMLRRQQAAAVIAAREKIVEGAVGMVDMALKAFEGKEVITLDEESKAAMVSNLMVVLCSDEAATPIVNAGTLNH
ncbi:SPFH domain / Band 7 family protein [Salinivirga cyanobacteriivorans]|uniref:SPFH domain / Band 7 family protein n=1 Tax=Salinivirga cyanobacteriivorans TaxID=1307839 RepID=A0A0S2HYV7_9BACT|nr:SPFH domain-containing protein [Salinivirga cyanobacteriivorans]ALO15208.1 SPFH domain / Band 7 family protein [Salinivirga cyanobacteriivorans]